MAIKKKKKTRKSGPKAHLKKKSKKKPAKRTKAKRAKTLKRGKKASSKPKAPKAQVIGIVTHYFPKVGAAVVKLKKPLAVGDNILIKGSTTNFEQKVESMQIEHVPIEHAKKGDEIGLAVRERVREHDLVLVPS